MKKIYNWEIDKNVLDKEIEEINIKMKELTTYIDVNSNYDFTEFETVEDAIEWLYEWLYDNFIVECDWDSFLDSEISIQIKDWTVYKIWMDGSQQKIIMDCWPNLFRNDWVESIWVIEN